MTRVDSSLRIAIRKSQRHVRTLIVVLPSAHRGGELIIRHAGREVTVDMAGAKTSELVFSAFYADCEHEVRPITEGDRVCLVYNLIQSRRDVSALEAFPKWLQQPAQTAAQASVVSRGPATHG